MPGVSQDGKKIPQGNTAGDTSVNVVSAATDTLHTNDTISQDSVNKVTTNPSGITEIIYYPARDSTKFDFAQSRIYLYGDADVTYGDMNIKAERIEIDLNNQEVFAYGLTDSLGKPIGLPMFKQGMDDYQAHEIRYNYGTQKGKIKDIVTQEGEGYLHAGQVKRMDDGSMNMVSGKYTTCDLVNPHFAIHASKLKLTNSDVIVAGPFNLEVADVPTPLGFPFGVFPTSKEKRQSGILIPTYGESRDRGFFLRDGGYYLGISDYVDMKLLGAFYTFGGYGVTVQSNYKKRYGYNGSVAARYNKRPVANEGPAVYINDVWFEWSHRPQTRKSSSFSANVQAGSMSYNKNNANLTEDFLRNDFQSTVSYSKTFTGTPFRLTASARQSQNVQTGLMNFTLPDVNFSMNRIYPFKTATSSGKGPLQQLNVAYNMNSQMKVSNRPVRLGTSGIRVVDPVLMPDTIYPINAENINTIFDQGAQYGMKHDIPISTTLKLFNYFSLNPSFNYSEFWYPKRINYSINAAGDSTRITEESGFSRASSYSTRADLTTRVYGLLQFRNSRLMAIRHVLTPTIGYSYSPDFSDRGMGIYQDAINNRGDVIRRSPFEGYIYGGPGANKTSALSFNLQNNIEMKLAPKGDSANAKPVKVSLIDNLGLSASYNMAQDSFQLSNLNFNARTTILNAVTVAINGVIDPYTYQIDDTDDGKFAQTRRASYAWSEGQGIGHLTNLGVTLGFNFNPQARQPRTAAIGSETEREMVEFINRNPDLYVDFNIPWSLQAQLNTSYSKIGFAEANTNYSLSFSGDVKVTDKWKVGFNSGYDFIAEDLTYTSLNIHRDLHCWEMRFNWIPFGLRQSYSFDINVKASILQDLKLSRRRSFIDNPAF